MLRRSHLPRMAAVHLLAAPVVVAVYLAAAGNRLWRGIRPAVALLLGATVISALYADLAWRRAPATPMRAAVGLVLAIILLSPGLGANPAQAARDPATAVVAAARSYLGTPYRLGTEGPDLFDCSGFIFRAFKDAGELPRISGMRLRAVGYMRWFVARGLFTRDVDKAQPGDLVVWNGGSHAGIYLGGGKAISALKNPWGITIHSLDGIGLPLDYFLTVDWGQGDSDHDGRPNGGNNTGGGDEEPSDREPPAVDPADPDRPRDRPRGRDEAAAGTSAVTTGTLNIRGAPNPDARIVGWIARGRQFKIVSTGRSPSGWLWYEIETTSGKRGWIWSYLTQMR